MQLKRTTAVAVTALALLPATALAAEIVGGPGNERLRGTNAVDQIDGNGGNDRIFGRGADDRLTGGTGHDRIFGDVGNDTLRGGDARDRLFGGAGNDNAFGEDGNDRIVGGTGDDVQEGGAGNDVIFANPGVDTSRGGEGNDILWALARSDVQGPGVDQVGDTLDGGPGDDRFRTRDGEVDRITCGAGTDRADLDPVDVIADATAENPNGSCEHVERKTAKPRDSRSEDKQESPADARRQS